MNSPKLFSALTTLTAATLTSASAWACPSHGAIFESPESFFFIAMVALVLLGWTGSLVSGALLFRFRKNLTVWRYLAITIIGAPVAALALTSLGGSAEYLLIKIMKFDLTDTAEIVCVVAVFGLSAVVQAGYTMAAYRTLRVAS